MHIHVSWYNQEQRMLLVSFPVVWNWDDFGVAYREVVRMAYNSPQAVDVIVDMRDVNRLPAHALNHAVWVASRWKDQFGQVVFVTEQRTLLPFGQAARNIIPRARRQAHHALTISEAAELIQSQRNHNIAPALSLPLHYTSL